MHRHAQIRSRNSFTLLELTIVMIIIALIMTLAGPRVSRGQSGLQRRLRTAEILSVFSHASARARALGRIIELRISPEENLLAIKDGGSRPEGGSAPEQSSAGTDSDSGSRAQASLIFRKYSQVRLPDKYIEWHLENVLLEEDQTLRYMFFPGGEATGQPFEITIAGQRYRLSLDRLTGQAQLLEIEN